MSWRNVDRNVDRWGSRYVYLQLDGERDRNNECTYEQHGFYNVYEFKHFQRNADVSINGGRTGR